MRASRGRPAYPAAEVRACDADREQVVAVLRERFADGSLNQDSFVLRVDAALRARWRGELAGILSDLPGRRMSAARAVLARVTQARRAAARRLGGHGPASPPAAFMLPSGTQVSFTIGRDADCDLVLSDMTVSRTHAGLRRDAGGGWLLSDAGSTNGTRLNGWRVTEPVPVRAGDRVSFGALTLLVTESARHAGVSVTQ